MKDQAHPMDNANRFKVGLFSSNCEGGLAITTVPERWHAGWDENVALAKLADEAGLEFMLPVGRWKGYGGKTDFQGSSFETITWACGLLAQTQRLCVFATVHAPMFHPLVAAKQLATVDHVSHGRFGVNIVCGWNQGEFEMFGQEQLEHDERYVYGQEWLDVLRLVWSGGEPRDYRGSHIRLAGVVGRPGPVDGGPVLINAGYSPAGRAFGERNCDFLLTSLVGFELGARDVAEITEGASRHGRRIGVIATAHVVCRESAAEAREFQQYVLDNGDREAAENLMTGMGLHGQSFPPGHYEAFRERFITGHGTYPIVGSPDDVAETLHQVWQAGFAGVGLGFVNYLDELPYFCGEVLPRLEARGIRVPAPDPSRSAL